MTLFKPVAKEGAASSPVRKGLVSVAFSGGVIGICFEAVLFSIEFARETFSFVDTGLATWTAQITKVNLTLRGLAPRTHYLPDLLFVPHIVLGALDCLHPTASVENGPPH